MEEDIYSVKRTNTTKIEDDRYYQQYFKHQMKDVPIDELKYLLRMFFNKAAVNMGKDAYDMPENTIEAILDFVIRDFKFIPVMYAGGAIIRGSLGKSDVKGRLVPRTVYGWFSEASVEYGKAQDNLRNRSYNENTAPVYDLKSYPLGQAICKKVDWLTAGVISIDDWDKIPLKDLSERIGKGLHPVPELFGVKSRNR